MSRYRVLYQGKKEQALVLCVSPLLVVTGLSLLSLQEHNYRECRCWPAEEEKRIPSWQSLRRTESPAGLLVAPHEGLGGSQTILFTLTFTHAAQNCWTFQHYEDIMGQVGKGVDSVGLENSFLSKSCPSCPSKPMELWANFLLSPAGLPESENDDPHLAGWREGQGSNITHLLGTDQVPS